MTEDSYKRVIRYQQREISQLKAKIADQQQTIACVDFIRRKREEQALKETRLHAV